MFCIVGIVQADPQQLLADILESTVRFCKTDQQP